MKLRLIILFFAFVSLLSRNKSQSIPNGNFELWEIDPSGVACPSMWTTQNEPEFVLVECDQGFEGNYAACLNVVWDYMLKKYCGATLTSNFILAGDHKISKLSGYCKGNSDNSDSLIIKISIFNDEEIVGSGSLSLLDNTDAWIKFEVKLHYFQDAIPTRIHIDISVKPETGGYHITTYCMDDLTLSHTWNFKPPNHDICRIPQINKVQSFIT